MLVQTLHAGATCFLAGLSWVVQIVVYPSFRVVGPTDAWAEFHERHSHHLAAVIALPWATQGISLAVLLVRQAGSPLLLAAAAVCAAGPVALTIVSAVPLHRRLSAYDPVLVGSLLRVNAVRTLLWTGGAVVAMALLAC